MKKSIKLINKVFLIILLFFGMLTLNGCGMKKEINKAKETLTSFMEYLKEENYNEAAKLFHPDVNCTAESISDTADDLKQEYGLDFSKDFKIIRSNSVYISLYDSQFDGSKAEIVFETTLGEIELYVKILSISNEKGEGIYSLYFEKKEK